MSAPLVSINLLIFNGKKYIKSCLSSVLAQTYPNIEILVIDNASSDNSAKIVKSLRSPKIKLIENKRNFGFAGAHNQGIEKTKGKYILCLNQDVILDKNFVARAVQILKKNSKIAALQGKLLRLDKNIKPTNVIDSTGLLMLRNRRIISRGQGKVDRGEYNKQEEIFGGDGAAPVYRRKALKDVAIDGEIFDEDFFAYKEDVDLAWRLRLYGWEAWYCPEARAWHARTSGESAAQTYLEIVKERRKISKFSKYVSFKNQRLMQIKNELCWLFIKHLLWILPKEIGSWFYVLLFERYTWKAIEDLLRQLPGAFKKRKIIMARRRVGTKKMKKWFKV